MPSYELHEDPVLIDPGYPADEKATPPIQGRKPQWRLQVTVYFDEPITLLHPPAFQGIDADKNVVFSTSTTITSDRNTPSDGQGGGVSFETWTDPDKDPETFGAELHAHLCKYADDVLVSARKQADPPKWFSFAFTGKRIDASKTDKPVEVMPADAEAGPSPAVIASPGE